MGKIENFIREEKNKYGKMYVDISFAIDNISPFLGDDLNKRRYAARLAPLKRYIELLESAETEVSKGGLLNMFKDDKYIDLLTDYKRDHREELNQLKKCCCCCCLSCAADCKFDSCLGCRNGAHVIQCDHKRISVVYHDDFSLNLTNNDTGKDDSFKVLATLEDAEKDKRYIITQSSSTGDKFILYYYPGIKEDTYGEITDEDEFDFIASTFQNIEE